LSSFLTLREFRVDNNIIIQILSTLTDGGVKMWRYIMMVVGLLVLVLNGACSFDNTPKRLPAYLPPAPAKGEAAVKSVTLPEGKVTGALVMINDTGFQKSAPGLEPGTLQNLGGYLQEEIQNQLPIQLSSVLYPDGIKPDGSADQYIQLAKDHGVPYLLLAILSSSEWEVSDHFPMGGALEGGGGRGWLLGWRDENYARLELALLEVQSGKLVVSTDGQAWAVLNRLVVPMESNVYPVVRRAQTQPPIYPNSEEDAFDTLRWVSGKDAITQAVMHLGEAWKKAKTS